jgi:hypothetical protein
MYIVADLASPRAEAGSHEIVLAFMRAYPDGALAMRPGFSKPGQKYRCTGRDGKPPTLRTHVSWR